MAERREREVKIKQEERPRLTLEEIDRLRVYGQKPLTQSVIDRARRRNK
jgi:hypothetical protein